MLMTACEMCDLSVVRLSVRLSCSCTLLKSLDTMGCYLAQTFEATLC